MTTLALLALLAALACLIAYRLWKLPALLKQREVATSANTLLSEPAPALTGHMVFSGPLEHNEHGFITTPMVDCSTKDPNCPCHTMRLGGLPQ